MQIIFHQIEIIAMESSRPISRALISVSNKTGLVEFAEKLTQQGIEIISTSGTAHFLTQHGIVVTEVCDYTQMAQMMNGRIKTLHHKIYGGILGRRGIDDDIMAQQAIKPIDMVVVNLYPFEQTIAQANCTVNDAIENIDIGGPTMIRAAAKNYQDVSVIVNSEDYNAVLTEMTQHNSALSLTTRFNLAIKAFEYTAAFDDAIANYLSAKMPYHHKSPSTENHSLVFPHSFNQQFIKKQDLRYGENNHQAAAFYIEDNADKSSIAHAKQWQGKALSYNNIADADTALECVKTFNEPACVIVKHANPCAVALADNIFDAYQKAYQADPISAFGGIIALNRQCDSQTAKAIVDNQFVELIIAPSICTDALKIIEMKKNIRLLEIKELDKYHVDLTKKSSITNNLDFKKVNGGLLVQERDHGAISFNDLAIVSKRTPNKKELQDALFCWKVAKFVKSNAVVYAKNEMTIGIGAGQMSRVYSAKIASIKAIDEGRNLIGAVMASDAFLPFRDSVDTAANAGITCIIQPGGSIRDDEVIAAADEHNIAMIFTHMRHFRH